MQQTINNTQWASDMNVQFLLTTKLSWPLRGITRSLPAIWFIWMFGNVSYYLGSAYGLPLSLQPYSCSTSMLKWGFFVSSPCYLQKTLNLCLCICSKFTLSTQYLSTVLHCKLPAASYSLWGIASFPALHGPSSLLSVPLLCETSVFSGQLPLLSACVLMISGIFQTILPEGRKVTTSLRLTLTEFFYCMEMWFLGSDPLGGRQRSHPGFREEYDDGCREVWLLQVNSCQHWIPIWIFWGAYKKKIWHLSVPFQRFLWDGLGGRLDQELVSRLRTIGLEC